jgi:hypothetical protein
MSQCLRSKEKNTRTITQINENEYLIEGKSDWARFGFEIDDNFLTFADLENGPFLHVGDNFLGKGRITLLQNIVTEKPGYITLKVTTSQRN